MGDTKTTARRAVFFDKYKKGDILNTMLKNLLLKKLLASKMKDVPKEQQDKLFNALEKNPQLFQNIAVEVQKKMKEGKDQMAATMEVMQKYQTELKKVIE